MWFVTKSRFEDAQQRIAELKAEKSRLEEEVVRLNNFIVWRSGGVPTHPELEVRPEWMKAQPGTPVQAKAPEAPSDPVARAILATGSRNPRVIAAHISKENQADFGRAVLTMPRKEAAPAKEAVPVTPAERAEVAAAAEDLEKALS